MPRQGTSMRLRPDLVEALAEQAREAGTSATALFERYLDEGLRQERHPLIQFRGGGGGRRPVLAGSRLTVAQVIDTIEATDGVTDAERIRDTAEYLAIPVPHVAASIRYYAEYNDEVDAWRNRAAEAAEREREAWRREQAVLA
jgi:uncharacterized protein (DUF433 family)